MKSIFAVLTTALAILAAPATFASDCPHELEAAMLRQQLAALRGGAGAVAQQQQELPDIGAPLKEVADFQFPADGSNPFFPDQQLPKQQPSAGTPAPAPQQPAVPRDLQSGNQSDGGKSNATMPQQPPPQNGNPVPSLGDPNALPPIEPQPSLPFLQDPAAAAVNSTTVHAAPIAVNGSLVPVNPAFPLTQRSNTTSIINNNTTTPVPLPLPGAAKNGTIEEEALPSLPNPIPPPSNAGFPVTSVNPHVKCRTTYVVKKEDTCNSVVDKMKTSIFMLYPANPGMLNCPRLDNLIGKSICIPEHP